MMDSCKDLIDRAHRSLKVAGHMIEKTYPMVNDPKLILAVAGDIYSAVLSSMTAVVLKEGEVVNEDFKSRFDSFRKLAPDYGFTSDDNLLIAKLDRIITAHRESPVEFPRKDHFVICGDKYDCMKLSIDEMKNYLFNATLFVEKADVVVKKGDISHERLLG